MKILSVLSTAVLSAASVAFGQYPAADMMVYGEEGKSFQRAYLSTQGALFHYARARARSATIYPVYFHAERTGLPDEVCRQNMLEPRVITFRFRGPETSVFEVKYRSCVHPLGERDAILDLQPIPDSELVLTHGESFVTLPAGRPDDPSSPYHWRTDNCSYAAERKEKICARVPGNGTVYGTTRLQVTSLSEGSLIRSVEPHPTERNCVNVSFMLTGKGYDEAFGVRSCRGSAYIQFRIDVFVALAPRVAEEGPLKKPFPLPVP